MAPRRILPLVLALGASLGGCDGQKTGSAEAPPSVPVTVAPLQASEPARYGRRMGLAEPYRQEDIGFEVGGRVVSVLDVGVELEGPVQDTKGVLVKEGDVVARLDPSRYAQRVTSLELRIAAEVAEKKAKTIEVEGVAKAQADLAKLTYERQLRLSRAGTATKEALDTAKADLDVANATLSLKEAQILAQEARIAELEAELTSARLDLGDCALRAPFSGRITAQHISRGAYVQPGTAIVTLTLIDPMSITLTLSADDERALAVGSPARIHVAGSDRQLHGRIRGKGQVADPRTRTFRVEVMTRNVRYETSSPLASVDKLVPIVSRFHGEEGPLYAASDALVKEGDATYLLVIPREQVFGAAGPVTEFVPQKVPVTLGKEHWTVLDWHLREVRGEGLRAEDFVVRYPKKADEARVEMTFHQWLIRPGDLIPVSFDMGSLPRGFYVPVTAIKELNGKTWVFLNAGGVAKQVEVTAYESYEGTRRVAGEGLEEGAELIIKGVHYLSDGARLNVRGGA
jgi:RND family efflux transporter MFP subunit